MLHLLIVIAALMSLPAPATAQSPPANPNVKRAPQTLAFGSRAGMEISITGKRALGTSQAVIYGQLTEENARTYCREYEQNSSANCRRRYIAETKLEDSISANCETGAFTTFYGALLQFEGVDRREDPPVPIVRDRRTAEILEDSAASDLQVSVEQFLALCPDGLVRTASSGAVARNTVVVVAKGAGVVPGAIICPDYRTVTMVFTRFAHSWNESMQDRLTGGQSTLLRGNAAAPPELASYGCAFAPAGTRMTLRQGNVVPVVSARLVDGRVVEGVTLPAMINRPN